jgi:hypothetical protein
VKRFLLPIAVSWAIISSLQGQEMTAKRIFELAKLPDDRSVVPDALQVFVKASEYVSRMIIATPDGNRVERMFWAKEKLVDGKYIVTMGRPPGSAGEMVMITWYDDFTKTYRKAVCMKVPRPPVVHHSIGIRLQDTHTLSWTGVGILAGTWLSIERHSPEKSTYREIYLSNGRIIKTIIGESVPTKHPNQKKK